jgi:nicotinate-nucleotide--dimethylbenzimidazole phosphoribosyltransferase
LGSVNTVNDLAARAESIGWPDHAAEQSAVEHKGGLGALDLLGEWVAGVQGSYPVRSFERARVIVFAADHGVAAAQVSRHQIGYAGEQAAVIRSGDGDLNDLAALTGAGVRVIGFPPSARIDREDALSAEAVAEAIATGIAAADDEIDAGADLLIMGNVGAASTTSAAALVSTLAGIEPVKTVGRGSGIDDDTWMRKATAVRDARRRSWPHRNDAVELLRVGGGADVAAMAGFAFQAAVRRTPLLLDGVLATAAGFAASTVQPRVARWWRGAQLTPEPAHQLALSRLGLTAILDLGVTSTDGTGGLLALPLVRAAIRPHRSADV